MNRPYTADSPYSLTPTERIATYAGEDVGEFGYDGLLEYPDDGDETDILEYDVQYDEESIDRRWMWIAGIAGVILFVAIGTTGIILGGGDSGSVTATGTSSDPMSAPAAPVATSTPGAAPSLPAETVTTVSPTAEATAAPQPESALPVAPPEAAVPAPSPRTITYRVTGNRPLLDLVTVIYTDQRGALQTDVNVALPWAKTVVLDPGVELKSITATSVGGQLNCGIYDATGTLIAFQSNNTMIATCTQ
ncbi:hypothetical protein [Mycolicibacterium tusciae]|uniref:hypothetical protein n=1 Tax=Mycolicibacterium tusciae TaxID=75922 RepID=UPI00024A5013|nr:hypothetical protein [Mycolicibacterium tusciae]